MTTIICHSTPLTPVGTEGQVHNQDGDPRADQNGQCSPSSRSNVHGSPYSDGTTIEVHDHGSQVSSNIDALSMNVSPGVQVLNTMMTNEIKKNACHYPDTCTHPMFQ